MRLVVIVPVGVVDVGFLARAAGKNGIGGDRSQLKVVPQNPPYDVQDGGVLHHLFKHTAFIQKIPHSSLQVRSSSVATLKTK